jgi:hypothetical protein
LISAWILKSGIPKIEIYSRQGHNPITSLKHYQSLFFTDYELRDIKRLTEWRILRQLIFIYFASIDAFYYKGVQRVMNTPPFRGCPTITDSNKKTTKRSI